MKAFGPVFAESFSEKTTDRFAVRTAKQSLETLHRERRTYAAALGLLEELDKGKGADPQGIQSNLSIIVDGCEHWTSEWQSERVWRRSHDHRPPFGTSTNRNGNI